jgi:D-alanyl-D-alanine dipeptidase
MKNLKLFFFFIIGLFACKKDPSPSPKPIPKNNVKIEKNEVIIQKDGNTPTKENTSIEIKEAPLNNNENSLTVTSPENKKGANFFKEIFKWKTGILLDIKYATTDNFTKKKIYDCGKCYLRPEAADALLKVHNELKEKYGYGLKVFDCFRPRPYQQRLWDIVPNPDYVTPPNKGSMHSRGLAVDLTIVDDKGKELDMGTPYDYFGKEAHTDFKGHSESVNKNREILTSTMVKYGFKGIRTEWWHFSIPISYPLDEWVWPCKK